MNRLFTRVRIVGWRAVGSRGLAPLLFSLAVLMGPGVRSASAAELTPQQKLEMKQLYERATRAYDVGKYNEAIEEYQKAYEIGGDPPMLYNIAQAYRLNDQPGEALRFYRRYLQRAPSARNREDVERKIAEIEKIVEDRRKTAAAVTPPPPAPAPASVASTPAPASPQTPTSPAPASTDATGTTGGASTTPAPVEDQGSGRVQKIVGWSIAGAGVLTCGVGAVFGILAKQKGNSLTTMSNTKPAVEFDPNIEQVGKNYNRVLIITEIAGGVLVAAGAIVALTAGSSSESAPAASPPATTARATFAPWLGAGLVGAGADFRF